MAIKTPVYNNFTGNQLSNAHFPTWTLANGDVGDVSKLGEYPDRTFQVDGTFGAGGSVTLRGSLVPNADPNNPAHWFNLHDFQGNELTFTAAGGGLIGENTLYVSPNCTAGDGTTAINVRILGKR